MFFNYQGIMMGETGQIWIASVDNGAGQWELKVIALNGLTQQVSLLSVMERVVGQGLENAIPYEQGYIGLQKDAIIELCTSENGRFEAYGIISPPSGKTYKNFDKNSFWYNRKEFLLCIKMKRLILQNKETN